MKKLKFEIRWDLIALWCFGLTFLGMAVGVVGFILENDDIMDIGGLLTMPLTIFLGGMVLIVVACSPFMLFDSIREWFRQRAKRN